MRIRRWIERKLLDATFSAVMSLDPDVVAEWANNKAIALEALSSEQHTVEAGCPCKSCDYHLKQIENEWVQRGIIQ